MFRKSYIVAFFPTNHFRKINHFSGLKISWIFLICLMTFSRLLYANFQSNDDRYSVKISLPKVIYKEYEPVFIKLEIVNKQDEPLKFYEMFNPEAQDINFIIRDNEGNEWEESKVTGIFHFAHLISSNMVGPYDTLTISMPINNWGNYLTHEKPGLDHLFGYWGYFAADRKYSVKFSKDGVESNLISFKVKQLNENDVLYINASEKLTASNYDSLVNVLPDNKFREYLSASSIIKKYGRITYDRDKDYDSLLVDYYRFTKEYPESYYLICDAFLAPLFIKLFDKASNYSDIIPLIISSSKSELFNRLLRSSNIDSRIKDILKYYDRRRKEDRK